MEFAVMSSRRSVATAMHTAQMMIADRYRIMLSGRLNQADDAAPRMRFFSFLDILSFGSERIGGKYGMVEECRGDWGWGVCVD